MHYDDAHIYLLGTSDRLLTASGSDRQQPYRSSLIGSRQLPTFLANGLPCDSPEHRAMASEYPTYKLDQNTVPDQSISWYRNN